MQKGAASRQHEVPVFQFALRAAVKKKGGGGNLNTKKTR